jgi:hypothetical protein
MSKTSENQEIILRMVGVGIMVTLYGVRLGKGKWKFTLDKNEGTMADFLLEEDADVLSTLRTRSNYVGTWDEALVLLDKYPWTYFVPKEVHPEFRELVWSAVESRNGKQSWRLEKHCYEEWKRFLTSE